MERIPCTPNPECKYAGRCFEDIHHPISKNFRKGKPSVITDASELTAYRNCRRVHEETEARSAPVEVTKEEAQRIVDTNAEWLPNCLVEQRMLAEAIASELAINGIRRAS